MKRGFLFAIAMVTLVASAFVAGQQSATRRIPEFDNDHVRVWKSLIAPRQPLTMHRHDQPRVLVALKGGTVKIVQESGESKTSTWEPGRAYWLPADPPGHRHADVNEGNETIEVIVVELKGTGKD